ncbi:hypothetical protein [Pseudoalteromonas phage PH357]|nr:hypothetical protein [Pseudoalteromonas phage PH357]
MADWIENKYKDCLGYIPNMKTDGSQEWSMVDVFGNPPPYSQEEFSKLCPRTKLTGNCKEGNEFCSICGTLTPSVPMSHHEDCDLFIESVEHYPTVEESWWLGVCPDCKVNDFPTLSIDSSIELGVSEISCSECGFSYQDECCEEELVERYNERFKEVL